MRIPRLIYKQNKSEKLTLIFLFLLSLTSCVTSRNTNYFQTLKKDTTVNNFVTNDFQNKIIPGDVLSIKAASLNSTEDAFFNQGGIEANSIGGIPVKEDGTIMLQRLGKVTAAGLTRKELAATIEKGLQPYMKEALVTVSFLNHKITLLGALGKPQILPMPTEQISIIDALVSSGDISATGNKKDIMIIREEEGKKKVKHVNLEDASIFTSPWYYLRPNDIVYVTNDKTVADKAEKKAKITNTLSLISSGLGLFLFILNLIKK